MEKIRVGDKVKYLGYIQEQVWWGNNDSPHMLSYDCVYEIVDVDVHRQHTKVQLKGIEGKFNSVHFEVIDSCPPKLNQICSLTNRFPIV